MGLEPIRVELSDFQKLGLLRDEEERLSEELAEVEKTIREQLLAAAGQQYLNTLASYYASREGGAAGADAAQVPELEARRQLIHQALEVVRVQREGLEGALGEEAKRASRQPRSQGPASKSSNFESFDDFRKTRG